MKKITPHGKPVQKMSSGRTDGGGSEGGAYPNPHTGEKPEEGGFMGHGGQSEQSYYGEDQLGERVVGKDENPNAATRKTKPGEDEDR